MKATIIYHSVSGNTKKMAEIIAEAMSTVEGMEAKAFSIDAVDEAYAKESKCIILGTPVYAASTSAAMKTWIETSLFKTCQTAGKLGGAFATVGYLHGGAELAIRTILDHLMVYGMLTYSSGAAEGAPVIHLGPVALGSDISEYEELFTIYGKRMANKAVELFA